MEKDSTILVTGAAGFTGKALALRLASEGYRVRGTIRPGGNADTRELRAAGVEIVDSDIGNAEDCRSAVKGCRYVFNIAAMFRRANGLDAEYDRINRLGVIHLIDAAIAEGVEKMVHCSTIGVCGHIARPPADETAPYNPGDIYQRTKLEGEKAALEAFRSGRLRGTVVRPAAIYGPGDMRLLKLFRMIAKQRMIVFGNGKPTFHMVYIDDLVEGFIRAMETKAADGDVFIVAGGEYVPLNTLFAKIAATLGVPPPRWHFPLWPVQFLGTIVESICVPLGINPPIYRRRVDFFAKSRAFDISKARRVLGYVPAISLDEGIRRMAEWALAADLLPAKAAQDAEMPDVMTSSQHYRTRFKGPVGDWFLKQQEEYLQHLLKAYPKARILDIGGGHGQYTGMLIREGYEVTVLGSAPEADAQIRNLVTSGKCRYVTGNLLALPFEPQSFDLVISFRLLAHVNDWQGFIRETARVASRAVIIDFPVLRSFNLAYPLGFWFKRMLEGETTRTFRVFSESRIVDAYRQAGFTRRECLHQFFLPMAVHRAVDAYAFSTGVEQWSRKLGLTRLFGSPAILNVERS